MPRLTPITERREQRGPARMDGPVDEHDLRPLGVQLRDGPRAAMSPDGT